MDEEIKNSVMKSGTSILGIVCKEGIVMAADRRATAGNLIMSKDTQKVVKINDYLITSGTGTASDIEMLKKLAAADLRLKHLKSKVRPLVKEGANLIGMIAYNNIRQFTQIPFIAGTLVAGFNEDGTTELYSVEPAGSVMKIEDYDANFSSGMPFILGLLERQYKKDMTIKEAVQLAVEAIKSSTQRDIGSGNAIDVFAITKDKIEHVVKQKIEAEYKEEK
jgi:proteasome beta subunit